LALTVFVGSAVSATAPLARDTTPFSSSSAAVCVARGTVGCDLQIKALLNPMEEVTYVTRAEVVEDEKRTKAQSQHKTIKPNGSGNVFRRPESKKDEQTE
jgi:hypothetical protein